MDEYKRYELSAMKGVKSVLMLLVVLYHSMLCSAGVSWGPEQAYKTSKVLYYISQLLGDIHIYAFTFASGYIYAYLRYETNRYDNSIAVIKKKFKRLIVPYMSTAFFWVVPIRCLFWKVSDKSIIAEYVLGLSPSQLWFLLMLFWQFLFFQRISAYLTTDRRNIIGCILFFAGSLYIGLVLSAVHFPNLFQLRTAMQYFLFFYMGIIFCRTQTAKYVSWKVFGGGTIATILFFYIEQLLQQNGGLTRYIAILLNPVISVLGTYSLVIGILLGCRMCLNSVSKINTDYAMSVYLFHQQLIYFSIHLFNKPWISPFGLTMINFGVGLVGGIMIHKLLKCSRITALLFGIT